MLFPDFLSGSTPGGVIEGLIETLMLGIDFRVGPLIWLWLGALATGCRSNIEGGLLGPLLFTLLFALLFTGLFDWD